MFNLVKENELLIKYFTIDYKLIIHEHRYSIWEFAIRMQLGLLTRVVEFILRKKLCMCPNVFFFRCYL